MFRERTLTILMSTGGEGEGDEPVAVYADPEEAHQAADDFNLQFKTRMWEPAWQYTREVPFIKRRHHRTQLLQKVGKRARQSPR